MIKKRKVFVTGPDGLLGSNLLRELLHQNFEVVAMVQTGRDPKTIKDLPINCVYGNVTNKEDLEEHSKGCDYFIHVAATTDVWPTHSPLYYKINVEGTCNAIEAALKNNIKRFIHIGSASSFGFGTDKHPGNESSSRSQISYKHDYMESKFQAQNEVLLAAKERGLPALILCPTFMIGPYDSKPGPGAILLAVAKKNLPFVSTGGKSWVHVRDVAITIVSALEKGKIGECYILGGENLTYVEAIKKIAEVLGQKKYPKTPIPNTLTIAGGLINSIYARLFKVRPRISYSMARQSCQKHYYSSEKAKNDLGYSNNHFEVAVQDLKSWFEQNGYL